MRRVALLLSASVLVASSGCASGERKAQEKRELIKVGMTKPEVKERLGAPAQVTSEGGALVHETWHYQVEVGSDSTLTVVLGTLLVVGLVAAAVAGKGGGGSIGGGGGGGSSKCQFKVFFDSSGRVSDISQVQPVGK